MLPSDSEASNHVTPEPHNLMHASTYHGADQLHVGNGQGLKVSHVGQSYFISSYCPATTLRQQDLVYFPSITKPN